MANRPLAPRLIAAAALMLVALVLLVWLVGDTIEVANNPAPQVVEAAEGEATIDFATDRTRFVFPGDCSTVRWRVEGIRAVHFYTYPVTGAGELPICHGDAPYLRVRLQDNRERIYTLDRDVLFLRPLVIAAALVGLAMGGLAAYLLGVSKHLSTRHRQYLAALVVAIAWVAILDLYTNSAYIVIGPTFDAARTLEIARNGWLGNPNLLAPWAYRPVTPLLARAISDLLGQPLDIGFTALAYMGAVAHLILVFTLARRFGANFRAGIAVMLVVGLSFFNLRFLLYDIYRPDHLAFPLMLIALLALLRGNAALCLLASCVGLLTREFLIIPAALLALKLLAEGVRERSWRKLAWLMVVIITTGSVTTLPRVLIPVADSAQRFDPLNRPDALLYELLAPWRNTSRNDEFLAVATSYLLPLLMLATPVRLRRAWTELAPYRGLLAIYVALVFLLTMYGGGDVHRYFSYLFAAQAVVLALWLRDAGWLEIVLMLLVTAVANRLFWMPNVAPITQALWIGSIVEPSVTTARLQEVAGYVAAAVTLRVAVYTLNVRLRPFIPVPLSEFREGERASARTAPPLNSGWSSMQRVNRLLYIANARIPTEKGHGLQIMQNCEAFADAGVEVTLWAARRINTPEMRADPFAYYGVKRNFELRRIPCIDLLSVMTSGWPSRIAFYLQRGTFTLAVCLLALFTRADIYYSRDPLALWALGIVKPRRKLVYEAHRLSAHWLHRQVVRRVGTVVAITPKLGDDLIALGADPARVLVAHDGIRRERFADAPDQKEARRVVGWPESAFIVGYVGRLHTLSMDKGLETLIAALRQVEGAALGLVGGPDDMAEALRQRWVSLGLDESRFLYAGHVLPERVPLYLSAFDVCAMPHPWTEHFAYHTSPIKLFEYMASQRAIVASDLPGWADVVQDGESALLVPPGDANALAAAITRLRDDPALRERLAANAYARVMERYTWAARAKAILGKVYNELRVSYDAPCP